MIIKQFILSSPVTNIIFIASHSETDLHREKRIVNALLKYMYLRYGWVFHLGGVTVSICLQFTEVASIGRLDP